MLFHNIVGATDYLCRSDDNVLNDVHHNHCKETPSFYPAEFEAAASAFLFEQFHMTPADITWDNAKFVYAFLSDILIE